MKEVIYINKEKKQDEKPVELTHYSDNDEGWVERNIELGKDEQLIYLGNCAVDGDVFASNDGEFIRIYKGHLNSGKY